MPMTREGIAARRKARTSTFLNIQGTNNHQLPRLGRQLANLNMA